MGYNIDDILNGLSGGSNSKSNFTLEQIEAAKKRQKKKGGNFYENLMEIASQTQESTPEKAKSGTFKKNASKTTGSVQDLTDSIRALNEELTKQINRDLAAQTQAIDELSSMPDFSSLSTDMGTSGSVNSSFAKAGEAEKTSIKQEPKEVVPEKNATALERFQGLADELKKDIYGQDDFLRKLVIAFKRPFVTGRDSNDAMNSIYITGKEATGRHFSLSRILEQLKQRGILTSSEIHTMNLALYPTQGEEKVFLQDLYVALSSSAPVILFENLEQCHTSLRNRLSELVATGECRLNERYLAQNGQLTSVNSAFVGNTVSTFEVGDKYLVFISSKPVDKLAGVMGAPFVNALGDVCSTTSLDDESMRKIASTKEAQMIEKCKKQLAFTVTCEDSFTALAPTKQGPTHSLKGILTFYADVQKALSELRLMRDDLPSNEITLKASEAEPAAVCGEEEILLMSLLPSEYKGELEAVKAEMESIVGLKQVKEYIYSLEEYFGVQKRRRESGLKASEVNKHMIFTGNPGTGKTTIARIVSKYLKAIGVLSGGQLIEVSRADLVGRYVGHTAPLVNQVIKSAIGGVLFIDEAYSLHRGKDDNFGLEAIDTLVKGIEDNRDNLIVILAGYSKEMEEFLESNSGLKSRFPNIIDFPDYTAEELYAIAEIQAKSKGYVLDESCKEPLLSYFTTVQAVRAMDAGNGRLVRNKLEEAILNQSRRLVAEPDAELSTIMPIDFDLSDALG